LFISSRQSTLLATSIPIRLRCSPPSAPAGYGRCVLFPPVTPAGLSARSPAGFPFQALIGRPAKICPSVRQLSTSRAFRLRRLLLRATLHERFSKLSEIPEEKSEMSELAFASEMMREKIAPPSLSSSISARILAAARALRWKYSRAKDVWYADERVSIKPRELRKIEELSGVQYGKAEADSVALLISRADALLESQDPDFHGPFVAALRALVGALDRPRAEKRDAAED
jgi:hypothetical protein